MTKLNLSLVLVVYAAAGLSAPASAATATAGTLTAASHVSPKCELNVSPPAAVSAAPLPSTDTPCVSNRLP